MMGLSPPGGQPSLLLGSFTLGESFLRQNKETVPHYSSCWSVLSHRVRLIFLTNDSASMLKDGG